MIPPLDDRGLLPAGVHECALDEAERWAQEDLHRQGIWAGLRSVLPTIRSPFTHRGLPPPPLTLAGSYFSDKPAPGDIEAVLALPPDVSAAVIGECYVCFQANRHRWHVEQRVDYYVMVAGMGNDFRDFFQYVGIKTGAAKGLPAKERRGIVQVTTW